MQIPFRKVTINTILVSFHKIINQLDTLADAKHDEHAVHGAQAERFLEIAADAHDESLRATKIANKLRNLVSEDDMI